MLFSRASRTRKLLGLYHDHHGVTLYTARGRGKVPSRRQGAHLYTCACLCVYVYVCVYMCVCVRVCVCVCKMLISVYRSIYLYAQVTLLVTIQSSGKTLINT